MIPPEMAQYPQFILYKKRTKEPVQIDNPKYPGDPHNADNWTDAKTAVTLAEALGFEYGVGFVFTKNDPFFFFDIDDCLDGNGNWSETAAFLWDYFVRQAGCAGEVSASGRGLHIFGQCNQDIPHRCKNSQADMEFYTEWRYAALTGFSQTGDAVPVRDEIIQWLVASYFNPEPEDNEQAEWTEEPDPEWSGPEDDEELIKKALNSKSANQAFGSRASFKDLWEGNEEVLGQFYPDGDQGREFDYSSADSALCSHLAFWTGKNCERIDRLFKQSGLYRDKWEDREDYRYRTVTKAVALCRNVYSDNRLKTDPDTPGLRSGFQFMDVAEQINYFAGCIGIFLEKAIFTPDGYLLGQDQFNMRYNGYVFALDSEGEKTTRKAWDAFVSNQGHFFPKVHRSCFRPERAPGEVFYEEGNSLVNIYVPAKINSKPGDPTPFLNHLHKLFPQRIDLDIVLAYCAAAVQYPGSKFRWCVAVQGTPGNGKSLIADCLKRAVGRKYTHTPNSQDFTSRFNDWIYGRILIIVEEMNSGQQQDIIEVMKPMITAPEMEVQGKGTQKREVDNRANFFITTNHKDGVKKHRDDRRYAVLYTPQQSAEDKIRDGLNSSYFYSFIHWLENGGYEIVTDYLKNYRIPDEYNPATKCLEAPITTSTYEAIEYGLNKIQEEILQAVDSEEAGFRGGWISSIAVNKLLLDRHIRAPRNKIKDMLREMGYIHHPCLAEGKAIYPIPWEGGKPRLYIKQNCSLERISRPADIVKAYINAQEIETGSRV